MHKSPPMSLDGVWMARIAWFALPLTVGPALAAALGEASAPVQIVGATLAWIAWGTGLVAVLVPRTVGLTALRIGAPAALAVALWAAATNGEVGPAEIVAVAWAAAAAAVVLFVPALADAFVDGSSYGPERRFVLRLPANLLLGPVELAWLAVAAGIVTGPLLLAARQWVAGAVAVAIGAPLVWLGLRALHQLSRRWVVYVPAGVVIHDPLALSDPVLFPKRSVRSLGAAAVDSEGTATDVSGRALGLVLELRLGEPVEIGLAARRAGERKVETDRLLFTPARPGAVLSEAASRGFPLA
ncbi:MAG: hypothetical protein QOF97_2720 [Acidimicrobiaceae bacterium]